LSISQFALRNRLLHNIKFFSFGNLIKLPAMRLSSTKSMVAVFVLFTAFSHNAFGQFEPPPTYSSDYAIKGETNFKTDYKARVITITDKEITISNFTGGTKTLYLVVDKIENKEWMFDGICKTYYCTTRDADPINGYQKAIVYNKYGSVVLGLFADEISIYKYEFNIK